MNQTIRIHSIQHVAFEGLGFIKDWAEQRQFPVSSTKLYDGEPLPDIDDFDFLVVMGGPMGVYDKNDYPWLEPEKKFIQQAITEKKFVVGICLGAQLIASSLGAKVYTNKHKEIGWFPIHFTAEAKALLPGIPASLTVMHWHGDTFDLPKGSVHLAASEACPHQAFLYHDRVLGLQCHLETTKESLQPLVANCSNELVNAPYIQNADLLLSETERCLTMNLLLGKMLDALLCQDKLKKKSP